VAGFGVNHRAWTRLAVAFSCFRLSIVERMLSRDLHVEQEAAGTFRDVLEDPEGPVGVRYVSLSGGNYAESLLPASPPTIRFVVFLASLVYRDSKMPSATIIWAARPPL
jgi:hypothetical protein